MRRPLKIDSVAISSKEADDNSEEVVNIINLSVLGQAPYLDQFQPESTPKPTEGEAE